MTAKEYLSQLRWLDNEIENIQTEIDYLRARAENCHAPEISDMPKGSGSRQQVDDLIIKIVDLQNYMNVQVDTLIDLRKKIMMMLSGMKDGRSRTILQKRYVQHKRWEIIADEMNYERSYLTRLHGKALKEFEKCYPEIKSIKKHHSPVVQCYQRSKGKRKPHN